MLFTNYTPEFIEFMERERGYTAIRKRGLVVGFKKGFQIITE